MKRVLFILIALISVVGFSQDTNSFEEGVNFYKEGEFQQAIASWSSVLESGEHSTALYYNLANAYFKNNQLAESIYYYEKALQLSPSDKDVLNNLAIAQNSTVDAIEAAPENIFESWYNNTVTLFSFNGWAILSVILMMLFALVFLWYYYSNSSSKKRLLFSGSIAVFLIAIVSLTAAFLSQNHLKNSRFAIIFAESSQVRSEPLSRSEVSFRLHEGTKVKITEQDNEWVRIEIADGKEGWMLKNDLKEL